MAEPASSRWHRPAALGLVGAILAYRVVLCAQPLGVSGDLVRHLGYGVEVGKHGLTVAAWGLALLRPDWTGIPWALQPYNYPPMALLFFTGLASLWPTMFFARLALTGLEGLCCWLIVRTTGSAPLGLICWVSPVSLWWVSHEGQIEPLQSALAMAAVWALRERRALAWPLLALAIQVKLTPLLLLPVFLAASWRDRRRDQLAQGLLFAAAFAPTALAMLEYPLLPQIVRHSSMTYANLYHWNLFDSRAFAFSPLTQIVFGQLAIAAAIGLLIWGFWSTPWPGRISCLPALSLLVALKVLDNVPPWYSLALLPLLAVVPRPRIRLALFALLPLFDVWALEALIRGCGDAQLPIPLVPGLGPFTPLR